MWCTSESNNNLIRRAAPAPSSSSLPSSSWCSSTLLLPSLIICIPTWPRCGGNVICAVWWRGRDHNILIRSKSKLYLWSLCKLISSIRIFFVFFLVRPDFTVNIISFFNGFIIIASSVAGQKVAGTVTSNRSRLPFPIVVSGGCQLFKLFPYLAQCYLLGADPTMHSWEDYIIAGAAYLPQWLLFSTNYIIAWPLCIVATNTVVATQSMCCTRES